MGIKDTNNNELVNFSTTASAVNEITVKNAATTAAPEISATGTDTNIDLKLTPKGSGKLDLDGIKFPNADGTSGQVLQTNGSGVLSFGTVGAAAGQVIQVVSTTKTNRFNASSTTTFTDITGLSVSITPSASANKILVMCSIAGGGNLERSAFRLVRGATAIGIADADGSRPQATVGWTAALSANDQLNASFNFLDSPSTTSSTTYKVQFIASATITINGTNENLNTNAASNSRTVSTITLMEIKG
jgi:hypothetical protein